MVLIIPFFLREGPTISNAGLREYVEIYLAEYRKFVEENLGLLDKRFIEGSSQSGSHNLTFYWRPPNQIDGIISRSRGAAIFFNRTERKNAEILVKSVMEPIEYQLWPEMIRDTTGLSIIRILKGTYHLDSQVFNDRALLYVDPGAELRYTGKGRAFNISENGAILILGSLIEEDRMLLKGSNNKEDWSRLQARFDALSEFLWDSRDILNETTIKTIEAKYKLTLLLEKIGARIENGRYREDPSLFTLDFEELKEVNAPDETLSKILNDFVNMQENPPSEWYESAWSFLSDNIGKVIVGLIVTVVGAFIVKKYVDPRMKKRRKKSTIDLASSGAKQVTPEEMKKLLDKLREQDA